MGYHYDYGVCRDCGKKRRVRHVEWIRASRPKCRACGGGLDPSMTASDEHAAHRDERDIRKEIGRQ